MLNVSSIIGKIPQPLRKALGTSKVPRLIPAPVRRVRHSGETVTITGPTSLYSHVFSEIMTPWRKGARPRIAEPYHLEVTGSSPRIALHNSPPLDGEFDLRIAVEDGDSRTYYKIDLGGLTSIDLDDIGINLPDGKGKIWATIAPGDGAAMRNSLVRQFVVRRQGEGRIDLSHTSAPDQDDFAAARECFYENLKRNTYENNHDLRKREVEAGADVVTFAPSVVQLHLGHVCNLNCVMCSTGRNPDWTGVPDELMDEIPLLFPFLDKFYVQGGEPFMFRSLRPLLQAANKHENMMVSIGTNGTMLLQDDWMDILMSGRYELPISVDAATKETGEKIRRKSSWEQLLQVLTYIRDNRLGPYPLVPLSFCIMRSNMAEIEQFVDLANDLGASSIYYNLMEPWDLEPENKGENLHDDIDACREVVFRLRRAYDRAESLGLIVHDKVLGWLLPKYPELVQSDSDLRVLPLEQQETVRSQLRSNLRQEGDFWKARGGQPPMEDLPPTYDRSYLDDLPPPRKKAQRMPDKPDGFFCSYPFTTLNFDTENSYVCCHAHTPFNNISYGAVKGIFDVWNSPLMQKARHSMFDRTAAEATCHSRCPYYRDGGFKNF